MDPFRFAPVVVGMRPLVLSLFRLANEPRSGKQKRLQEEILAKQICFYVFRFFSSKTWMDSWLENE